MSVRYGPSILWIATVAVAMQLIFNLEAIRYTLYTGEPILTGVLRLKPGPGWWATVYIFLACAQLGVPALASGCGTVLFAAFAGRLPDATIAADTANLLYVTYGVIALGLVILLSGRTIERTLEYASWFMILFIMTFLVVVNVLFVPAAHWGQTLVGFLHFGTLPKGMDLMLLATFAATAGSGGIGNLVISNWVRDKGYGMGSKVGAIGSAFSELGEHSVELAHVGTTFPITSDNLRRWGTWWTYVSLDQVLLWGGGCVVGMFLNVNLATFIAPPGTDLTKVGAGAFQAQYMAEQLWSGFWFLALLNGFWILFSTHLGNTDTLVRLVTDILWSASPALRCRSSTSSGRIYL